MQEIEKIDQGASPGVQEEETGSIDPAAETEEKSLGADLEEEKEDKDPGAETR